MKKNGLSPLLSDTEGYVSIPLWEQEDNKCTYFDHWHQAVNCLGYYG